MPQTDNSLAPLLPRPSSISYEFEQLHQESQYTVTKNSPVNDPYATFTDNFDLSLLPQTNNTISDTTKRTPNCTETSITNNIPMIVYDFDTITQSRDHLLQQKSNSLEVPNIKIEQTWSSCPSLNTIKQEQTYQSYFPLNTKQNQLVPPPPAYSYHIYPSPQSSPAQSEYNFSHNQYISSPTSSACYESLGSSRNSLYNAASSPCPSIDATATKQDQLHILPPSPPESNCDTPTSQSVYNSCSSGFDFKSEPFDSDVETLNNLNKSQKAATLLLDYLEDTTLQKRHNLKSLALESFIGSLDEVRDNFEPVISLALEHTRREAEATCAKLQISQDPSSWSTNQVHAWLRSTLQQYQLPVIDNIEKKFEENGAELLQLSEDEFTKRIPECGSTLHAQLEIWKLTCFPDYSKNSEHNQIIQPQNMWNNNVKHTYSSGMEEDTEDEEDFLTNSTTTTTSEQKLPGLATSGTFTANDETINTNAHDLHNINNSASNNGEVTNITPIKRNGNRNGGSHIHLWQFLKELLAAPHINGTAIRWIDRNKGIFRIEDSVRVAKLWGKRKNRPAMNYDKLSRSIRQYYKKAIMKKTERSQRLVYQFCQPYHM